MPFVDTSTLLLSSACWTGTGDRRCDCEGDPNATKARALWLLAFLCQRCSRRCWLRFTIEFDNEFEHQSPHRTTRYGSTAGSRQDPWLGSTVMWLNCMQFVSDEGVTVREVERLARTTTNWNGMERWGTSSSNRIRPIAGQGRLAPTGQITILQILL